MVFAATSGQTTFSVCNNAGYTPMWEVARAHGSHVGAPEPPIGGGDFSVGHRCCGGFRGSRPLLRTNLFKRFAVRSEKIPTSTPFRSCAATMGVQGQLKL